MESLPCGRKFAELVADHVLGNGDRDVILSIVYGEPETIFENVSLHGSEQSTAYPTNVGRIVQERACVLITTLFCSAWRRVGKLTK